MTLRNFAFRHCNWLTEPFYVLFTSTIFLHHFRLRNGTVNCNVEIRITQQGLEGWANLGGIHGSPGQKIREFREKHVASFQKWLTEAIERVVRHYGAFPCTSQPIQKINLVFDVRDAVASVGREQDEPTITIAYSVMELSNVLLSPLQVLTHELFHIVSKEHHNEDEVKQIIERWQKKLSSAVTENEERVEAQLSDLIAHCETHDSDSARELEFFLSQAKEFFYSQCYRKFWNHVDDSGLTVIAVELQDEHFLQQVGFRDKGKATRLRNELKRIKSLRSRLTAQFDPLLDLAEFMLCGCNMPYESAPYFILAFDAEWNDEHPYAKLSEDHEASKAVKQFVTVIDQDASEPARSCFLDYFREYLKIVDAQAIHNDPQNPDIKQQIHNVQSLRQAKVAYRALNREFGKLVSRLK